MHFEAACCAAPSAELKRVGRDSLLPVQAGGPSNPPQEEKGSTPIQANRMPTANCNKQFSGPEFQPTPHGIWCKNFFQMFCLCVHHTQECLIFPICGPHSIKNCINIYAPDFVKQWLADALIVSTLIKCFKNLDWVTMC
jgi:hypothetical protein